MSKCVTLSPVLVCYTDTATGAKSTLIQHIIYEDGRAIGQAYTTVADTETIFDISLGTVVGGACPVASPDVEWEKLCDEDANGDVIEFFRRSITSFDANGDVIDPVATADFALDKITPYVVAGTIVACQEGCDTVGSIGTITSWAQVIS